MTVSAGAGAEKIPCYSCQSVYHKRNRHSVLETTLHAIFEPEESSQVMQ